MNLNQSELNVSEGKKAVFFGELLMRLGTKRYERFLQSREFEIGFTGAEANAAVSLANYGIDSYLVSVIPDNEIGQACINFIRQFGVNVDYISRNGPRLGTFYLETGVSQRPSKVIYDRAGSSITQIQTVQIKWEEIFKGKHWFHFSGTAPALSNGMAQAVEEACVAAKNMGLTVSCDLNYRRKLWSPQRAQAVMIPLMKFVDVLIGNEEDSALVLGVKPEGVDVTQGSLAIEKYKDMVGQLHDRFGFRYVVTSLRESQSASKNTWSGLLSDGKNFFQSQKYDISIVDRVGSGDSFSGGVIYGAMTGMHCQEMINFAVAASCLKHSIHGDFNLVSLQDVMKLLKGDGSGRIER